MKSSSAVCKPVQLCQGINKPYGLKTSTEENRKGYPGFSTIYEQKSKLTVLEIWSVILNRSI
jgi:hypothetical protein